MLVFVSVAYLVKVRVIDIPWLQGFIVENLRAQPKGEGVVFDDKSLATMLHILPHWSICHTSAIDTTFNLATTSSNGLLLFKLLSQQGYLLIRGLETTYFRQCIRVTLTSL